MGGANAKPLFSARIEQNDTDGGTDKDLKARQHQEVAKIKHEHYQARRLRKLSQLVRTAEQLAHEKRLERERADAEYEQSKGRKGLDPNSSKIMSNKGLGGERPDNFYKVKANRHMMQTLSPGKDASRTHLIDPQKNHQLKQIEFYQKHGKKAGDLELAAVERSRRAESMLVGEGNRGRNNRGGHLTTMAAYNKGLPPGTSQSVLSSTGAFTKTQMRHERAKLNQQVLAQAEAERLNHQALRKVKKFKMSEKTQKELRYMHQQKIEKLNKHLEQAQKIVQDAQKYRIKESVQQFK